MAQKFITKVSPELTDDATLRHPNNADNAAKTVGSTFLLYPGTYDAITGAWDGVAFIGVGDKEDVIVNGVVLANNSANTVTFENMTIKGSNSSFASSSMAIQKVGTNSITIKLREVVLSNAAFGINCQGTSSTVTAKFVDATGVDKFSTMGAGGNVNISFSELNIASTNSYSNAITGTHTVSVVATQGGAANGIGAIETVRALIS